MYQNRSIAAFGHLQKAVKDYSKIQVSDIRDCFQQFLIFFIMDNSIGNVTADTRIVGKKLCINPFRSAVLPVCQRDILTDCVKIREKILLFIICKSLFNR